MRKLFIVIVAAGMAPACNPAPLAPGGLVPAGTHQSAITAVTGPGRGGVSVTSKAIPEGTMAVDISIIVADARPNATYVVQRAPDFPRTLGSDGVCQRALGLPPWTDDPPVPAFLTFPLGAGVAVLTTSATGAGSLSFEYRSPPISAGTLFDVMFRIVDSESAPTTELRSGCFTVAVK
jgi:hypothetical protein